jgi:hypothetical protein
VVVITVTTLGVGGASVSVGVGGASVGVSATVSVILASAVCAAAVNTAFASPSVGVSTAGVALLQEARIKDNPINSARSRFIIFNIAPRFLIHGSVSSYDRMIKAAAKRA